MAMARERLLGEHELDAVQLEELLVLARERVLGLGEDAHEVVLVQVVDGADDREPADELGDEPEVEQVLRKRVREDRAGILVGLARRRRP